jgi:hypothetical protein
MLLSMTSIVMFCVGKEELIVQDFNLHVAAPSSLLWIRYMHFRYGYCMQF